MGQNDYEVFAMPTFDIVADEYQKALQEAPAYPPFVAEESYP